MGNDQRAQRILGGNPAGIADHMRVSGMQSQAAFKQDSGIHAGQHGQTPARPDREVPKVEVPYKFFVGFQQFVGDWQFVTLCLKCGRERSRDTALGSRWLSLQFNRYNRPVNLEDTIVAIAPPPGRSGIGVVRIAGPRAREIALPMLRLKHELQPGRAVFGELVEAGVSSFQLPVSGAAHTGNWKQETGNSTRIDEVVVTYFAKPHSYTTDDIIEISAHGSPVVLRHIVELCIASGARLAEPGEFTMRAFLNGRIDLTQAEAVRDLVDSQTLYQAKVAAQQLEGALSKRLQPIKKTLVDLIAVMEAGIDFAEDDVAVLPPEQILARIAAVRQPLGALAATFAYGKIVHEGLTFAIVGRPNVGKSSLFNRLVERERAIVTATPGTTRDLVTETVTIGGIPIQLVDTAGIRQ